MEGRVARLVEAHCVPEELGENLEEEIRHLGGNKGGGLGRGLKQPGDEKRQATCTAAVQLLLRRR